MTLIELLVSISILAVVGGVLAGAIDVGIHSLERGGAGDRIANTRDVAAFEQLLSVDAGRASCVAQPGTNTLTGYGRCSTLTVARFPQCNNSSQAFLCVSWPNWSANQCHVAVYSATNTTITRTEYAGTGLLTSRRVATVGDVVSATLNVTASTPASGKQWTSLVTVTIKPASGTSTSNPLVGNFAFHPLATDPNAVALVSPIC